MGAVPARPHPLRPGTRRHHCRSARGVVGSARASLGRRCRCGRSGCPQPAHGRRAHRCSGCLGCRAGDGSTRGLCRNDGSPHRRPRSGAPLSRIPEGASRHGAPGRRHSRCGFRSRPRSRARHHLERRGRGVMGAPRPLLECARCRSAPLAPDRLRSPRRLTGPQRRGRALVCQRLGPVHRVRPAGPARFRACRARARGTGRGARRGCCFCTHPAYRVARREGGPAQWASARAGRPARLPAFARLRGVP
ncbi:unannotated protein [freshwater metagenome]|uniref:Unannotated protein n=1 Tax=freshwater metagenome TaxID=449393 RepID=A0A6J7NY45_9ZZZZ